MPESGTYGSVRGVPGNGHPYRDHRVWMLAPTLIKGMRTFDTVENRGYVLVSPR
jgi:hypothetical protein